MATSYLLELDQEEAKLLRQALYECGCGSSDPSFSIKVFNSINIIDSAKVLFKRLNDFDGELTLNELEAAASGLSFCLNAAKDTKKYSGVFNNFEVVKETQRLRGKIIRLENKVSSRNNFKGRGTFSE